MSNPDKRCPWCGSEPTMDSHRAMAVGLVTFGCSDSDHECRVTPYAAEPTLDEARAAWNAMDTGEVRDD